MSAVKPQAWLEPGRLAFDAATDRVGIIMHIGDPWTGDTSDATAYLRPPGGGREWQTEIESLSPAGVRS